MLLSAKDAQSNSQFSYEKVRAKYPSLYSILEPIQEKITNWDLLGQIFEKAIMQNECRQKPLNHNFIEVSFVAFIVMRVPLKDSAQVILELYPPNIMGNTSSEENFRVIDLINAKIAPLFQEIKNQHLNFGNKTAEEFAKYEIAEESNKAALLCLQQYQDIKNLTNRGNQMQPTSSSSRLPIQLIPIENIDTREQRANAAERRAVEGRRQNETSIIEPIERKEKERKVIGVDQSARKISLVELNLGDDFERLSPEEKVNHLMQEMKKIEFEKIELKDEIKVHEFDKIKLEDKVKNLGKQVSSLLAENKVIKEQRDIFEAQCKSLEESFTLLESNHAAYKARLEEMENAQNIMLVVATVAAGVALATAAYVFGPDAAKSVANFFKKD